jgi:hypothetical protein
LFSSGALNLLDGNAGKVIGVDCGNVDDVLCTLETDKNKKGRVFLLWRKKAYAKAKTLCFKMGKI